MTEQQKQKLISVIRADCKVRRFYVDCDGNTCAIGAMVQATGNKEAFDLLLKHQTTIIRSRDLSMVHELLFEHYGLTVCELQGIQSHNDEQLTPEHRQRAIIKYIEGIPVSA